MRAKLPRPLTPNSTKSTRCAPSTSGRRRSRSVRYVVERAKQGAVHTRQPEQLFPAIKVPAPSPRGWGALTPGDPSCSLFSTAHARARAGSPLSNVQLAAAKPHRRHDE